MEYKVIRETRFNCFNKEIGKSVFLAEWSTELDDITSILDDTTIYHTEEKETSYGYVEWEAIFRNKDFADTSFLDESQLIKND